MMTDSLDGGPWFSLALWLVIATVMTLLCWLVYGADYSGAESYFPLMMFVGCLSMWAFCEVTPRVIDRLKQSWGI